MSANPIPAITEYILQDERNVLLSEAIYSGSYADARGQIMKGFFDRLTPM